MILGVVCLVLIDLAILGIYTLVEGVRQNLDVKRIPNREFSQETIGVSHTVPEKGGVCTNGICG